MGNNYKITIDGHPNFYNNMSSRKIDLYISEPEHGVNVNTGILNIISGFGGNATSNVYKKIRDLFSDKYNMVVVQCNYFGWEFMQDKILQEDISNFNDMGLLQAIDNIFSVIVVSEILKDNNLAFDAGKIISYGHSHGAYLSYLSNVFAPNLFSLIIDNSSWLYPVYMQADRYLNINGTSNIFHYLMRSFDNDFDIYNLKYLYKNFKNKCLIHSFHGADDNLISLPEKRNFCLPLKKCILHEISSTDINNIFKSTSHGLDSDHLLLFDYVMDNFKLNFFKPKHEISIINHRIETKKYSYLFDYSSNVPFLTRDSK